MRGRYSNLGSELQMTTMNWISLPKVSLLTHNGSFVLCPSGMELWSSYRLKLRLKTPGSDSSPGCWDLWFLVLLTLNPGCERRFRVKLCGDVTLKDWSITALKPTKKCFFYLSKNVMHWLQSCWALVCKVRLGPKGSRIRVDSMAIL